MTKLSIVIPAYNEEKTLLQILEKVEAVDLTFGKIKLDKEIIIVDDCSKDGTRDILKTLEKKYKVIYQKKNGGKGKALRTGFKYATGDIIIVQDADLEYNPEDYKHVLKPILQNKTKVCYGSRFLNYKPKEGVVDSHIFGNKMLSLITSIIYFRKITDMETCYKCFRSSVLKKIPRLKATRFDFEPELTAKIIRSGYKIMEVPIEYHPRGFEEGKKISWRDGVKALFFLMKFRFFN